MMCRIVFVVLTFLCLAILISCRNHRPNDLRLIHIESLLEEHPDSALSLLQDLSDRFSMTDADKAYYALLMTAATDKNALSLLPCDSLLDDALLYYGDKDKEKAVALLYKGRLFAEMNDPKSAIEYSLKALDVLQYYPEDVKYRRLIYGALGLWYVDSKLYDKALETLNQSLAYSLTPKDSSIAYGNMSHACFMKDSKDSTIVYQRKAIKYAQASKDSACICSAWHNLSVYYASFEDLDSALLYAKKAIQGIPCNSLSYDTYCYNIGELYLRIEQYDSARVYLNQCVQYKPNMKYWALSWLEAMQDNYKSAYFYLDSCVTIEDSLRLEDKVSEIQHLVYKHQTEMKVQEEKSILRFKGFVIIACVVIILLLVTVFYQHKVNKKEKETALSKQALCHAEKRLCEMKQRINENESAIALLREKEDKYGTEIVQRENVIMQLNDEAFALRFWLFKNTRIYKKIQLLQKQEVSSKKERKVMSADEHQELMNTVFEIYVDYISSLKNRHPRLTDDDLLLLCLQKMDFPSLTIALCFGYSDTSTINQRKSRLKAKMS